MVKDSSQSEGTRNESLNLSEIDPQLRQSITAPAVEKMPIKPSKKEKKEPDPNEILITELQ